MFNKRGLSQVITMLITILLVMVAVGIVWGVISKIITEGTEEINLGKFTLNLDVKSVKVNPGDVEVKVKRNPGKGDLSGLKIVVSDGVNSQVFDEVTSLQELGEQTFNLPYDGIVKEVSVAPILKTTSGKPLVGGVVDNFEFTSREALKNVGGLVSWWRFEGDANDEIGNNHGTLNGGVNCNVAGKYGKACGFDGIDGAVNLPGTDELALKDSVTTIIIWANVNQLGANDYAELYSVTSGVFSGTTGIMWRGNQNQIGILVHQNPSDYFVPVDLDFNIWHQVIVEIDRNSNSAKVYVNGVYEGQTLNWPSYTLTANNVNIGGNLITGNNLDFLDGSIDEVMIFNKSLSSEEIKGLYNLDLG